MVEQAVEERRGDDVVAEDLAPLLEAPVGGEDHGAVFVLCVDELEEQVGAALGQRQIADLVDDQQRVVGEEADPDLQLAFPFGLLERGDDLRQGAEVDGLGGLDGLDAERDRKMGLAGAGRNRDILPGIRRRGDGSFICSISGLVRQSLSLGGTGTAASRS